MLSKIDTLLNQSNINLDLNEYLCLNKNFMNLAENIAEKEDDAKPVKNDEMTCAVISPTLHSSTGFQVNLDRTDNFQDNATYKNHHRSDIDNISINNEVKSYDTPQHFINREITKDDNSLIVNQSEILRNTDSTVTTNQDVTSNEDKQLEKLMYKNDILHLEPNYKDLENKMKSLWEELEKLQLQLTEVWEACNIMRSELEEYTDTFNNRCITDDVSENKIVFQSDHIGVVEIVNQISNTVNNTHKEYTTEFKNSRNKNSVATLHEDNIIPII